MSTLRKQGYIHNRNRSVNISASISHFFLALWCILLVTATYKRKSDNQRESPLLTHCIYVWHSVDPSSITGHPIRSPSLTRSDFLCTEPEVINWAPEHNWVWPSNKINSNLKKNDCKLKFSYILFVHYSVNRY